VHWPTEPLKKARVLGEDVGTLDGHYQPYSDDSEGNDDGNENWQRGNSSGVEFADVHTESSLGKVLVSLKDRISTCDTYRDKRGR
jgi:hypothetical protein